MKYCFSELCIPENLIHYKKNVGFALALLVGCVFFPLSGQAQVPQEKQYTSGATAVPAASVQAPLPQGNTPSMIPSTPATGGVGITTPGVGVTAEKGASTGKPLPYFLSLRSDEVNMRAGPGARYPVIWTYHRRSMPVKVTREFDIWRLVEDVDGQKGWIQQAILSGGRSFIIAGEPLSVGQEAVNQDKDKEKKKNEHMDSRIVGYIADAQSIQPGKNSIIVRAEANDTATPVAVLKSGVVGALKECPTGSEWCKVSVKGYTGWILRNALWGVLPQEVIEAH